jgi:hypothetical protein
LVRNRHVIDEFVPRHRVSLVKHAVSVVRHAVTIIRHTVTTIFCATRSPKASRNCAASSRMQRLTTDCWRHPTASPTSGYAEKREEGKKQKGG